jgi:small redox-active disulfide protein 2
MDIKILGAGCPRCEELKKRTLNVLAELGIAAKVEKVTDIKEIAAFGVMATPALVVDGKVVSAGRIPRAEEIKGWVLEARA